VLTTHRWLSRFVVRLGVSVTQLGIESIHSRSEH
jgi:hypothetical protein